MVSLNTDYNDSNLHSNGKLKCRPRYRKVVQNYETLLQGLSHRVIS